MLNILCDKSPQGIAPAASTREPSEIGRKERPGASTLGRTGGALFATMFHGKHDGETTPDVSRET